MEPLNHCHRIRKETTCLAFSRLDATVEPGHVSRFSFPVDVFPFSGFLKLPSDVYLKSVCLVTEHIKKYDLVSLRLLVLV